MTERVEIVGKVAALFEERTEELAKDVDLKVDGAEAVLQRESYGPLLGIMPWNFPDYQVARFAASNLVLENTIVLKHAEICPKPAQAIQDIVDAAGAPAGCSGTSTPPTTWSRRSSPTSASPACP